MAHAGKEEVMKLRPDEIEYSGAIIRAWMSRNARTWHVSIRTFNGKTPHSLMAYTNSDSSESAWADGRDIADLLYWPDNAASRREADEKYGRRHEDTEERSV